MGRIKCGGGNGGEPADSPPESQCGFRIDLRRPARSVGADQSMFADPDLRRLDKGGISGDVELQSMPLARGKASLDLSRVVARRQRIGRAMPA